MIKRQSWMLRLSETVAERNTGVPVSSAAQMKLKGMKNCSLAFFIKYVLFVLTGEEDL
jgi:hypothetical protein